jgi:hypothetical protein
MNDGFRVRVELAAANVVGRYACGEHKVCVAAVSNEDRVNRVFEQAGVPYGPHMEQRRGKVMQVPGLRENA